MAFNFRNALENYDGDIEMLRSLVLGYIERMPTDLTRISEWLNAGNLEDATMRAHALKGGAGYVGADGIRDIAFELEKAGHNGDIERAKSLVARLREEFEKYLHTVSTHNWDKSETDD